MTHAPHPKPLSCRINDPLMKQEELLLDVSEQVCGYLEAHRIRHKTLARRMKRSEGHVSQLLNGSRNLTLRTLSDIAHHMGAVVTISIKEPK